MLVKELQGLGLRVDLLDEGGVVDAEHVIASSGPADKTVPQTASDDDDDDGQVYLDESDDIGDIEAGMSVQDIDEVEEIKEEA